MSFWYLEVFQKWKKKIRLYYYSTSSRIVFVRFLRELKTPKRHFKINWPLGVNSTKCDGELGKFDWITCSSYSLKSRKTGTYFKNSKDIKFQIFNVNLQLRLYFYVLYWSVKGQLISTCLFGVFNSPKKRTKTIRLEVP